ncbi:MAG: NusG domain II-containing protein [Deferribacterales bacterium]
MKKNKSDLIFIALLLCGVLFFMFRGHEGEKRLYLINNNIKTELTLQKDFLKLDNGHVLIETSEEGARFVESNCPNKICIKQGWVTKCGDTAVCVPKHLALVIECKEQDYDAISQ